MQTLDRYLIRQTVPPFFLALGIFTFLLAIRPMLDKASDLLAKGVSIETVGILLVLLLPQALALTLPMSFLAGLLMALGRMSQDREGVALLACGVSPLRLLRPVLLMATVMFGLTLYVLLEAVPDCNQRYREITYGLLVKQTETEIKPRLFYEGFPPFVLYYRNNLATGGWSGVMLADTTRPGRPTMMMARTGRLELDPVKRVVNIHLNDAVKYSPGLAADGTDGVYDVQTAGNQRQSINPDTVYSDAIISKGVTEKTIAELKVQIAQKLALTPPLSPHQEIMAIHQKFSFPISCSVFALLGLALGLHTRAEGKLGGMALGLGVIFVSYGLLELSESWTKGHVFPAAWARDFPNVVLGPLGIAALWWRTRGATRKFPIRVPEGLLTWMRGLRAARRTRVKPKPKFVLIVRTPVFHVPHPRILDLYIAGRYLRMLALTFLGMMGLYYIGTIIDFSDKVFKHQATFGMLMQYLAYSTPQFIYFVIPVATLVAVLGTIGGMTRTNELTVMRACGVSLYRSALPLVLLAVVWSTLLFQMNEGFIARTERKRQTLESIMKNQRPRSYEVDDRNWLNDPENSRVIYYVAFQNRRDLLNVTIFQTQDEPFQLTSQTYAMRASAGPKGWMAENGWVQKFQARGRQFREKFDKRPLDLPPVANFLASDAEADLMTYGQLRAYTKRLKNKGLNLTEQRVSLYGKIAFPLVTVVMTLIGIPFGVTTGRRGALYGIGLAVILAVSYWLASTIFQAAGNAELMPALLAAWAPNILFTAVGGYMMLTVRT